MDNTHGSSFEPANSNGGQPAILEFSPDGRSRYDRNAKTYLHELLYYFQTSEIHGHFGLQLGPFEGIFEQLPAFAAVLQRQKRLLGDRPERDVGPVS